MLHNVPAVRLVAIADAIAKLAPICGPATKWRALPTLKRRITRLAQRLLMHRVFDKPAGAARHRWAGS